MNKQIVLLKLACLPMLAGCLVGQTPGSWNHNPQSPSGPLRWVSVAPSYATCGGAPDLTGKPFLQVGMKQTPINIESQRAVPASLPALAFEYKETPLEVENTGHVVELMYEAGSLLRIGTSPTDEYKLVQLHFHAPSEHTVDGKSYDGELHLVHTNSLGEIVVVGVLLNKSQSATPGIYDEIVGVAPARVAAAGVEGKKLNAKDLLPASKSFYTYTGSLTTPPCTESVRWFVLATPVVVTDSSIRQLHALIGTFPGYDGYQNNNRPVAPLNGRAVMLVR